MACAFKPLWIWFLSFLKAVEEVLRTHLPVDKQMPVEGMSLEFACVIWECIADSLMCACREVLLSVGNMGWQ